MERKIHVFTDADLDGTISYLTLCWFFKKLLNVTVTTKKNFKEDFNNFLQKNDVNSFDKIYILDIAVCDCISMIDYKNITIVDHHPESYNPPNNFKNAKTLFAQEGSTCKLLYKKLKDAFKTDLSPQQKLLISIGHDYDSYLLVYGNLSVGLNTLFWNYQGNRLEKFVKRFFEGFVQFTSDEKKSLLFYQKKIDRLIKETPIYTGEVMLGTKKTKISSVMCNFCVNEVAQKIINLTDCDVCIIVNTDSNSVNFRRSAKSNINVGSLAAALCEGGGHAAAAGGKITSKFVSFTKLLPTILSYDQ